MLSIDLPPDLDARLEAIANKTGRTKSFYARLAVAEYIDDLEAISLAEERLRTPDAVTVSWEELVRRHFDDAS